MSKHIDLSFTGGRANSNKSSSNIESPISMVTARNKLK